MYITAVAARRYTRTLPIEINNLKVKLYFNKAISCGCGNNGNPKLIKKTVHNYHENRNIHVAIYLIIYIVHIIYNIYLIPIQYTRIYSLE